MSAAVEFQLNEFATVSAAATSARAESDTVVLTVSVEPAVWEQIDLLQLFHLGWADRLDGEVSGTGPVEIDLRLDPAVAAEAGDLPAEAEALSTAIANGPAALREHTSWYALSVTEAIDLPPELAELGDVRSGFTTVWADQPTA